MCGAPGNRAAQKSLTLTLSRQRERELGREEVGKLILLDLVLLRVFVDAAAAGLAAV
jgi:hypothetical protein